MKYISQTFQIPLSEIANELGIKRQSVNEWVGKKRKPIPEKHIPKIATMFNLDESWFRKNELLGSERLELQRIYVDRNASFEEYVDFIEDEDGNVHEITKSFSPDEAVSQHLWHHQQAEKLIEDVKFLINIEAEGHEDFYQNIIRDVLTMAKTKDSAKVKMLKDVLEYLIYSDDEFGGFRLFKDKELTSKLDDLKSYYNKK
ncbi:MAG: helix-turn-helix domain-containing protein [Bacillaceae bacterium]|nr:helix-turn-helix domain-containing protein [Bacillaceae bacterium]